MPCKVPALAAGGPLIFRQLFEKVSSTYTYLLADARTKEAAIIDPVLETVDRDKTLLSDLDLKLGPIINTHVHADHVSGSGLLKDIPGSFSVLGYYEGARVDQFVKNGDIIKFGNFELECRSTPGHTVGCTTFVLHDAGLVFTGDALFVRGCGRTDFQGGSAETLYESVHEQIFSLPDDFLIFPGHDYFGQSVTTVGEEKRLNPRLTKCKAEFIEIMGNLKLDRPKLMDHAVPLNLNDGLAS